MGSTNKTTNYELSQFVGSDKPSWLGDYNADMGKIDLAIKARAVEAGQAQASADTANGKADALDTRMDTAEDNILALQNASTTDHTQIATNTANISKNAQDIVQLDAKIGHTQITIGDHTVTGAIAELAQGGGITVDDAESTTSENPLQNKVITVAMNAVRGLITAIQNLLGSTNISSIGDGTVTGAISALSQSSGGNVRWDATTDRFEVLKNGTWTQSIRAFVNSIAVWAAGAFGIEVDNGTHPFSSSAPNAAAFTINGSSLVRASTVGDMVRTTLVSKDEIDFSNYSVVTVKTSSTNDITLNVSNLNRSGYLCVYTNRASSATAGVYTYAFGVCVSSAKDNFHDNLIDSLIAQDNANITGAQDISINEITVE